MHKPEEIKHDMSHLNYAKLFTTPVNQTFFWLLELCSSMAQFLVNLTMKKSTVLMSNF